MDLSVHPTTSPEVSLDTNSVDISLENSEDRVEDSVSQVDVFKTPAILLLAPFRYSMVILYLASAATHQCPMTSRLGVVITEVIKGLQGFWWKVDWLSL